MVLKARIVAMRIVGESAGALSAGFLLPAAPSGATTQAYRLPRNNRLSAFTPGASSTGLRSVI